MKPYGLRPGDGVKGSRHGIGNKYTRLIGGEEKGPKGKHREAKMHQEKMLVHRQGRADGKRAIRDGMNE